MPYASKAQARRFHSDPKLQQYAAEYDAATEAAGGFSKLPERVRPKTHPAHTAITHMLAAGGNHRR